MDCSPNNNYIFIKTTKWFVMAMIFMIPIQIILFLASPMPTSALEWMELLHSSPVMGLLHLDLLYICNNTFLIFLYFVLYITLKSKDNSLLNMAFLLGMTGAVLYYVSNRSIEMLYLSKRFYAVTDSAVQQSYLLTAESYLDIWKGTAFNIYYVLSALSLILFSIVMLKHSFYTKKTAIAGLVSGVLMAIPSSVGMLGLVLSLLSLIPWILFCLLIVTCLSKMKKVDPIFKS
ncbi:MAG: hypothetical protein RBS25_03415 [Bacilli bacterium]|jgi:hypothetical protein|nr:hypothetical protein [Bacilli bacterium]